jgi:hypothetical protein
VERALLPASCGGTKPSGQECPFYTNKNSAALRDNISAVPITDTRPAAREVQLRVHNSMSGEQRLLLAFEMSLFARDLARAGIRRDHPEWDEARVDRELLRLAFLPAPLPERLR